MEEAKKSNTEWLTEERQSGRNALVQKRDIVELLQNVESYFAEKGVWISNVSEIETSMDGDAYDVRVTLTFNPESLHTRMRVKGCACLDGK
jgi:hypothetical protein